MQPAIRLRSATHRSLHFYCLWATPRRMNDFSDPNKSLLHTAPPGKEGAKENLWAENVRLTSWSGDSQICCANGAANRTFKTESKGRSSGSGGVKPPLPLSHSRFASLILEQPVEEPANLTEGSVVIPVMPVVMPVRVVAVRIIVNMSVRIYAPITVPYPGITIYAPVSPIDAVMRLLHLVRIIIIIPLRVCWNDGRRYCRKHKDAYQ